MQDIFIYASLLIVGVIVGVVIAKIAVKDAQQAAPCLDREDDLPEVRLLWVELDRLGHRGRMLRTRTATEQHDLIHVGVGAKPEPTLVVNADMVPHVATV